MVRHRIIILLTFASMSLGAQDVEFKAEAPKLVRQGQQFVLQFIANDNIDDIQLPEVDGLSILGGPSTSTSQSIQIINGKTTRNVEISYSYYVRIDKAGLLTIPPARAKIKKKWYTSAPLRIEALGQGSSSTQNNNTGNNNSQAQPLSGPELFIQAIPSKRTAYIGEPISVELKIYTKVNISDIASNFKEADFQGFYKEQLEIPRITKLEPEKYNNEIYHTAVRARYLVIPQKAGKLTIDPFEQEIQLQQKNQQRRQSNSPFDDFFFSPYQNVWVNYISKPVSINVKPLPQGAPESFSGAVGSYTLNSILTGESITTNDAVSVKLSVKGTGNLKLVNQLPLRIPPTFESLEPQVSASINTGVSGYSGTKRFTYTLIPRSAGEFKLPPLEFSYFNPSSGTYKTLSTPEYNITVEKGEGAGNVAVVSGLSKEEVKFIGEDIRFIKTREPDFVSKSAFIVKKTHLKWMYIIPLVLISLFVALKFKQLKEYRNLARIKNKKAGKLAQKRLKKAKACMNNSDTGNFYEEILKALSGYLCDKLAVNLSAFNKDKAIELLTDNNIDAGLVQEVANIMEQCEYAHYAPSATSGNLQEMYGKARKTIINLENKLKK